MKSINAAHFKATTSTGEIELDDVVLTGEMNLKTSSGDVELNRCDANTMIITTASGDVEGTLLTDKIFYVATNSGDVIVPKSTQGGMCEVTTSSGDVELELINHKTKH